MEERRPGMGLSPTAESSLVTSSPAIAPAPKGILDPATGKPEQERHFEIEDDEEDRHQIEADVELHAGVVKSVESAFIGGQLFRIGLLVGDQERGDQERQPNQARDPDKHHKR